MKSYRETNGCALHREDKTIALELVKLFKEGAGDEIYCINYIAKLWLKTKPTTLHSLLSACIYHRIEDKFFDTYHKGELGTYLSELTEVKESLLNSYKESIKTSVDRNFFEMARGHFDRVFEIDNWIKTIQSTKLHIEENFVY